MIKPVARVMRDDQLASKETKPNQIEKNPPNQQERADCQASWLHRELAVP
jgi:hypothetical protein